MKIFICAYPYLKLVSLLFCLLRLDLLDHSSLITFFIPLECSQQGGVHELCFVTFLLTMRKLCIFELFFVFKIKINKNFYIYSGCGVGTAHTNLV